jgi:2-oxoglutarate ferredoxin oxidoreductase subunit beta
MHTIHGRAPALATGLKVARPDLDVWVITGDGDSLCPSAATTRCTCCGATRTSRCMLFNNQHLWAHQGPVLTDLGRSGPGRRRRRPARSITRSTRCSSRSAPARPSSRAPPTPTAKGLAAILERAYRHQGSALIEILQNCPVFNDGVWDEVKDDVAHRQLALVDGQPLTFAGGTKGVRLSADLVPEIVDVGEGGVDPSALLVHKERSSSAYAHLIASLTHPEFPVPVGVLHVEDKASFDAMAHQQVADAISKQGKGELSKLLTSGMTWEVGADGVRQ